MKKINSLAEYMQLASRTCPDLGTNKLNAFHMNSGIITEIGEGVDPIKKHIAYGKPLDLVNVGEEVADCIWYIANKARMFLSASVKERVWGTDEDFNKGILDFEKTFKEYFEKAKTKQEKLILATNFMYVVSYTIVDVEDFSEETSLGLPNVVLLKKVCDLLDLDFFQILTNNIEKLKVRYPEKFDAELAQNRNLEAEREALEK